jgi:hypothetical protein
VVTVVILVALVVLGAAVWVGQLVRERKRRQQHRGKWQKPGSS